MRNDTRAGFEVFSVTRAVVLAAALGEALAMLFTVGIPELVLDFIEIAVDLVDAGRDEAGLRSVESGGRVSLTSQAHYDS